MWFIIALLRFNSHKHTVTIQPFKVYSSVVFSIFRVVKLSINFRTRSSPPEETLYPLAVFPHFLPASHRLPICCVSVDSPVLGISYKWNRTINGPLWLAGWRLRMVVHLQRKMKPSLHEQITLLKIVEILVSLYNQSHKLAIEQHNIFINIKWEKQSLKGSLFCFIRMSIY